VLLCHCIVNIAIAAVDSVLFLGDRLYKSSAVAKMDDRLATIYMGRKVGAVVTLSVDDWEYPI